MRYLLDANLLIALTEVGHFSHARATAWFQDCGGAFATCPITQGALVRYMLRTKSGGVHDAKKLLARVMAMAGHEFWPDTASYLDIRGAGVVGEGQVTDAYLVALADRYEGRVATFDRGLAGLHGRAVLLVE